MSDSMEQFEARLTASLMAYASSGAVERPASEVVAAVRSSPASVRQALRRPRLEVWVFRAAVVGVAIALLAGVAVVKLGQPPGHGSFAASATVNGVEYQVTTAYDLVLNNSDLLAFGEIEATNVPDSFGSLTVYQVGSIPPLAALVAENDPDHHEEGASRLMWGPNSADAFPAICQYLPRDVRAVTAGCP